MSSKVHLPPSRDRGFWVLCGVGGAVALVLDQLTKHHAESVYLLAPPSPTMAHHKAASAVLADLHFVQLKITHVANAGVVLGLLEETFWPLPVIAFYGASFLALVAAAALARPRHGDDRLTRVASLALVVGVLGNLADRLRLGYVIDWFYAEAHVASRLFVLPAFNVADLALVLGVTIAVAHFARTHLRRRTSAGAVTSRRTAPDTPG